VRCTSCGRVDEVPGCVLEQATATVQLQTGFRISDHQLVFSGTCPECRTASASGRA
jgi:Fe2+ or Zn2+ uptake regulation protein